MRRIFLRTVILILTFSFCLQTKKSGWDFRSPSGLFFAVFSQQNSAAGSIGGQIAGFTSGTLVLKNGNTEQSLNAGAVSYKFTGLKTGETYSIEVKTNPSALQCTVTNSSGVFKANVENADITCISFSVAAFFPLNGKNWNDYIQRDYSKELSSQSDTACNPTDPGNRNYYSCFHGAEIKKAEAAGLSDCTGITGEDNANTSGGALRGINIQNTNGFSRLKNVSVENSAGFGIQITSNSSKNIFENVSIFNAGQRGIELSTPGSSSNLFINTVSASNSTAGVYVDLNSPGNIFINSTLALNGQTGMTVNSGSTFIMNSFISNNNAAAEGFNCTVGDLDMTALNTILSNNNANAAASQINSQGNGTVNFKRYMGIFKSSGSCTGGGVSFDGISASGCLAVGQSDFTNQLTDFSAANPFISSSSKASSDTVNADFSSGTKTYSSNLSWGGFQNFYRTAGKENANPFPSTTLLSSCSGAAVCRLYDWTFSASDSIARNSVICPEKLTRPTVVFSGQTVLRNAYEILGDFIGDDDGLCESNEECVYTPNIGAYQGHGSLIPASSANTYYTSSLNQCTDTITSASGSDGTVTNIKLYKYEKNGY